MRSKSPRERERERECERHGGQYEGGIPKNFANMTCLARTPSRLSPTTGPPPPRPPPSSPDRPAAAPTANPEAAPPAAPAPTSPSPAPSACWSSPPASCSCRHREHGEPWGNGVCVTILTGGGYGCGKVGWSPGLSSRGLRLFYLMTSMEGS